MKVFIAVILASVFAVASADAGLNQQQYTQRYSMRSTNSVYWPDVRRCLAAWRNHPFRGQHNTRFRIISAKVRVFGLGQNIIDNARTSYPQLIYIKAAVSVMSKTTYRLNNPNGWYCFEAKVNVLGKSIIRAACRSHIATTKGNVAVFGTNRGTRGTTVFGKSQIFRNCR